jgi:hypothetical protein
MLKYMYDTPTKGKALKAASQHGSTRGRGGDYVTGYEFQKFGDPLASRKNLYETVTLPPSWATMSISM